MSQVELFFEALKFMVLGMVIVYSFLGVMVLVLKWQAKLIEKFFPEKTPTIPTKELKATKQTKDEDENEIVSAITAAILHHNYLKVK